jgi:acyl-CoA dehydrogenase
MTHPFYQQEHEAFRESVRRFALKEIEPHAAAWDEAGTFPRTLYKQAAAVGLMQLNYPEEYGGVPADRFHLIIAQQELARGGTGGVNASLMSHTLALPPVAAYGSDDVKAEVLPAVLSGEKISALAITEPSGGSDVANLRTRARRDGDTYVVDGSKTFITCGMRADYFTTAVRTGGPGMGGISFLLIKGDTAGLSRTSLSKMGWWASDTATLHFDQCRVPARYLLGAENAGFGAVMANFNNERLGLAASAIAFARVAYEEARDYAGLREAFGKPIRQNQVIRHKLVDMYQRIERAQALLEMTTWRMENDIDAIADICVLKNEATQTMTYCAREAVHILGGAGYLRGGKVERIYRETQVISIGGGTEEIMKELAAKRLGL